MEALGCPGFGGVMPDSTSSNNRPKRYPAGLKERAVRILRCSALENVGLFWEPLFLFWEDTDLSLRLRRAGWGLGVVAKAWIWHEVHGSVSSPLVDCYHYRNAVLTARRHGPGAAALTAFARLGVVIGRRWAGALLRRRPAQAAATRGLLAGAVESIRTGAVRPAVRDVDAGPILTP
jgi:GT2 family glycosyltransferase